MRALDLFCGAGGTGKGLAAAGFEVIGIDIKPQPSYPFRFIQADALDASGFALAPFDFVWLSPPCQRYCKMTRERWQNEESHPDLVARARAMVVASGIPYAIENVPGAPLLDPFTLCGSMFGLGVRRHRIFETSFPVTPPSCAHKAQGRAVRVYGNPGGSSKRDAVKFSSVDEWRAAMGIPWMGAKELALAIPPAYSEFIARAWLASRA